MPGLYIGGSHIGTFFLVVVTAWLFGWWYSPSVAFGCSCSKQDLFLAVVPIRGFRSVVIQAWFSIAWWLSTLSFWLVMVQGWFLVGGGPRMVFSWWWSKNGFGWWWSKGGFCLCGPRMVFGWWWSKNGFSLVSGQSFKLFYIAWIENCSSTSSHIPCSLYSAVWHNIDFIFMLCFFNFLKNNHQQ